MKLLIKFLALNETPSHNYGVSFALWDQTHLTQVNTPHLNPSQTGQYLIHLLQRDRRLS